MPVHSRDRAEWSRFLHLIRTAYSSSFAALVSIDDRGPAVIDWVDSRLDASFSENVARLEAEFGLFAILDNTTRPLVAASVGDWAGIRISYFARRPVIAVAVLVPDCGRNLVDTTAFYSFEKVVSAFLDLPPHHDASRAQVSWDDRLAGGGTAPCAGVDALQTKQ